MCKVTVFSEFKAFKFICILNLEFRKSRTIKRDFRTLGKVWIKCSKSVNPATKLNSKPEQPLQLYLHLAGSGRRGSAAHMVRQCRTYAAVPHVKCGSATLNLPLGPVGYKYFFYPSHNGHLSHFFFHLVTDSQRQLSCSLSLSIEAP